MNIGSSDNNALWFESEGKSDEESESKIITSLSINKVFDLSSMVFICLQSQAEESQYCIHFNFLFGNYIGVLGYMFICNDKPK